MPDVSNHRIGDYDYFNKLTDTMKKPLFKEAYYKFLWKRYEDTKHFNFDKKPTSNTRSEKIASSIPRIYKYIKEYYIIPRLDLNERTSNFFQEYYNHSGDKSSKVKLGKKLKDIGIEREKKKVHGKTQNKFIKSHQELYNLFKKRHYICEEYEPLNEIENERDGEVEVEVKKKSKKTKAFSLKKLMQGSMKVELDLTDDESD